MPGFFFATNYHKITQKNTERQATDHTDKHGLKNLRKELLYFSCDFVCFRGKKKINREYGNQKSVAIREIRGSNAAGIHLRSKSFSGLSCDFVLIRGPLFCRRQSPL